MDSRGGEFICLTLLFSLERVGRSGAQPTTSPVSLSALLGFPAAATCRPALFFGSASLRHLVLARSCFKKYLPSPFHEWH